MKFLAFFGHINIDVKISVPRLPMREESVGVKNVSNEFAGTAGNFAFVAAALGLSFDLYSKVGSLTHNDYINELRRRKINIDHVEIENSMGPICYIPTDGNEQVAYMYQGPMDSWRPSLSFDYNYKYVHLGTGPSDEYQKIAANNEKSRIVFDPGQEIWYLYNKDKIIDIMSRSYISMFNKNEFNYLKSMTGLSEHELNNLSDYIIVTMGSDGASVFHKNNEFHVPAVKSDFIYDTIGAGDSFRAGFYFGIYNNYSINDSVLIGNIVASIAIRRRIIEFNENRNNIIKMFNNMKLKQRV
ncbi:nucleoside kinase [Picrophilus oshimae]|uniref:6-phosphofructokinase n=1 Tax=Picrophilus torridus (strain ATCC 700027 / DSM 9790 / JCM 10055 / NBRC 100828 / KAW 2/3) TaxID=1122961 RepID=Q6KZN0_PICTO|nr:nucleoside kinase [Picrophilus oshimae]AAT43822.1 6-phosphofructokinase [Picrophilus oshimae DSM 9789]